MAKITKRTKKDGTCSYCIRVSNGYDRQGRQVLVNRTFTPPPGLTGKKLEKELQRQADAFEQEVHSGISLEASMKLDDLIEKWFTEYADRQLKPKTATEYRKLVPRVSAALGHMKVNQIRPAHLMAFYANLSEDGVRPRFHLYSNGGPAEASAERPAGKDPGSRRGGRGNHAGAVQRQACQP